MALLQGQDPAPIHNPKMEGQAVQEPVAQQSFVILGIVLPLHVRYIQTLLAVCNISHWGFYTSVEQQDFKIIQKISKEKELKFLHSRSKMRPGDEF